MPSPLNSLPMSVLDKLREFDKSQLQANYMLDETMLYSAKGDARKEIFDMAERRVRQQLAHVICQEKGEIERREVPHGLQFRQTVFVFTPAELAKLLQYTYDHAYNYGAYGRSGR